MHQLQNTLANSQPIHNLEQACSTLMSFQFFTVLAVREGRGLWENWLITETLFPSQPASGPAHKRHQGIVTGCFRGNPEDDQSVNPAKEGTKEGDQSEGNPKRGIQTHALCALALPT